MFSLLPTFLLAQFGPPPPLDPRTYVSPSGRARLWVNPDGPEGAGKATYRLMVDGRVRWTKVFPFTLDRVGVADDGTAGGYGSRGFASFVVAIVRPDGTLALDEKHTRTSSRYPDGPPNPQGDGLVLDAPNDRMIVRIGDPDINRNLETWWTYRLSTGKRGPNLQPASPGGRSWIVAARPVPETKLILLDWWRFDEEKGATGASFTLVDEAARPMWRLDLPGDYELGGSKASQDALREAMQTKGAILGVGPSRFELRHVKAGRRVAYEIRDGKVEKTGQTTYVPPSVPSPPKEPALSFGKLVVRARTVLPLVPSESPVHDVGEFFAVAGDRLVFLRGGDAPAIVEVDAQGHLRRILPLGFGRRQENEDRRLAWTGGTRFVLVRSRGDRAPTHAWRIDLDASRTTPIEAFRSDPVKQIAGRPDGSFVALTTGGLAFFDASGRRRWIRPTEGGYGGKPEEMLSPEDVEFDSRGRIVVLDNVVPRFQRFDVSGRFLGNVDLKRPEGRASSYLTNLSRDSGEGLWLVDFTRERQLVRLRADGKLLGRWTPRLPNGERVDLTQDPRVDARGRVWMTNGYSLFQLDGKGGVRRTLGPESDGRLREIRDLFVAPSGAVYALDARDQSVHVIDASGRTRFVARPRTGDFDERPEASLQVTRSGDIYLEGGKRNVLHFSPKGRRLSDQPEPGGRGGDPKPRTIPPTWRWRRRWLTNDLLDDRGRSIARLRRWPNGDWLSYDFETYALDGHMLAYDLNVGPDAPRRFAVYSASGLPQRMGTLPASLGSFEYIAFDGEAIFLKRRDELFTVGLDGKPRGRFRLPGVGGQVFPTLDGFAWFDGAKTVVRFAQPLHAKVKSPCSRWLQPPRELSPRRTA